MMKEGWCKNHNGYNNRQCDAGVNYRELVGGPDYGWAFRTPCRRENKSDIQCTHYIDIEEIKQHDKEMDDHLRFMMEAIKTIRAKHPECSPQFSPSMNQEKKGATGTIECPKCGGELSYSIAAGNHHIWGSCNTEGCLQWMM